MPFALNEATRFISPTKTPEFLAAGVPVVSTADPDVVRPYGENGLVEIAASAEEIVGQAQMLMERPREAWLERVDRHLAHESWDRTWAAMQRLIRDVTLAKAAANDRREQRPPRSSSRKAPRMFDWLIVGAGFAGSTLAERLASQRGDKVLVIDKRHPYRRQCL